MIDRMNVEKSMEMLCKHLADLNEMVERDGWTCVAQVHDMAKTLHGLKSAHAILSSNVM